MRRHYRGNDVVRLHAVTRRFALIAACVAIAACGSDKPEVNNEHAAVRVVSLAPNLTELVYTVGAGEQLVGVSAWSDYPRAVLDLPVVGDAFTVDHEQLALTAPDLLLVWQSGTPLHTVDDLKRAGYKVATVRTRGLDDIAVAMRQIGALTGHELEAEAAAERYSRELEALRAEHKDASKIRVFYQVSARPLYTVNREHYVSELIALCGGVNIFDDLDELAPTVDVEAVVDRDPEVLLGSTDAGDAAFSQWLRWPAMAANRYANQYLLPGDEIGRASTRLLIAGKAMCLALTQARTNREKGR